MNPDGRTRLRLGTASNRLSRWLAVLFPFSLAGSLLGQGYLFTAPNYPGAPAVPSMGNVNSSTGPANSEPGAQSTGQLGTQAYGEINGQPAAQANSPATSAPQLKGQLTPPAESQTEGEPSGTAAAPLTAPVNSLMQWGALHMHAHASYQFLYASGIHSQPGKNEDTFTHTLSPGISLNIGPHVNLSYSPSIRFFSQKDFHTTVDHLATMTAGARYGDWSFGLSQSFSAVDEPIVETSSQTAQKDYSAGLSASYQVSDKLSLVTSGSVSLMFVDDGTTNVFLGNGTNGTPSSLSGSRSYSGSETLNYQFGEKISGGFGVTVAYSEQAGGYQSVNETVHGHLTWQPGSKFSAALTVGLDHQDFLSSGASAAWNPIYNASISYHLFEPTTLSLYADHSIGASLFQNQITKTTAVGVGVQQRLLGKLQLSLGFGYTKSDYEDTTADLARSRGDEGTSYNAGLTFPFLKRCSFATFYQYTQNTSTTGGFGYSSSQVGATLSWNY